MDRSVRACRAVLLTGLLVVVTGLAAAAALSAAGSPAASAVAIGAIRALVLTPMLALLAGAFADKRPWTAVCVVAIPLAALFFEAFR